MYIDKDNKDNIVLLSIDSSSNRSGWAVFINGEYVKSGVIDLSHIGETDLRLRRMVGKLQTMIDHYSPAVVVVEETVVLRNPAVQRLLTMILGAIYGKCADAGISYVSLRPTEWRKAVDPSKKPRRRDELKKWSREKVGEIFGVEVPSDDESDAILLGLGYINMCNG